MQTCAFRKTDRQSRRRLQAAHGLDRGFLRQQLVHGDHQDQHDQQVDGEKRDGDVVAFHSCIADEFKDFLIDKLKFEGPSCSRHKYMEIYKKDDGKYYLKLALQFRFKLKK